MTPEKLIVVRPSEGRAPPGDATPGIERRELLDDGERWVGWSRTAPGMASGWHHHGQRDTYLFMTRGSISFEFGPGGRDRVTCAAGEFAVVPGGTVHREVTGSNEPGEGFVVRLGSGAQNVNVDGPDPEAT